MLQRSAGVLFRRTLDGAVILPAGADDPLRLNPTAAALWDLLEVPSTVEQLAATVSDVYDVSIDDALSDVRAGVDALAAAGAIVDASRA